MSSLRRSACHLILIGTAAVMIVDLFLDWRRGSSLNALGLPVSHSHSAGLAGWGSAAAAFLVALLVTEVFDLATGKWTNRLADIEALLAVGVLVATFGAFVGGAADVSGRGVVELTVLWANEWPAYLAVALAALIAFVALGRSVIEARAGLSQRETPSAPSTTGQLSRVDRHGRAAGGHAAHQGAV